MKARKEQKVETLATFGAISNSLPKFTEKQMLDMADKLEEVLGKKNEASEFFRIIAGK